jgi:steroid delta-isomerase-like uncharacterized protein
MAIAENKALVRRLYDAIEREDWDDVAQLFHRDFVFYHQVDTPILGAQGFIESEKKNFDAIPGFKISVIDLVAEENKVAAYLIIEGKQTKELMGIPARGAKVRFSLLNLLTIVDGKIIEKRAHFDVHDIIRQLKSEG